MPNFSYRAIDASGKSITGQMDAADRRSLVQRLSSQGIKPISIEQKDRLLATDDIDSESIDFYASSKSSSGFFKFKQPRAKLALQFFKRLLSLLAAGMALGDATRLMSLRLKDPQLNELCQSVWKMLSEGHTLAQALGQKKLFTPAQIHLVEAGEASGNLVPVLKRLVAQMEESAEVKKKVVNSLSYPLFIILVALVVVIIILTFLMPRIEAIMTQLGGDMFFLARWLITGADLTKSLGPFALAGLFALIAIIKQWRKSDKGRRTTDLWLLRSPLMGTIYLYGNIYSTSNLLATLLGSGVNTTEALRLVERTIPNVILRAKFAAARKQIQEGVSMANAIQKVHYMPDLAMDILTVGENTGDIVTSLNDINQVYREELTKKLDMLTKLTAGLALSSALIIVGVVAISIVVSVISVNKAIL